MSHNNDRFLNKDCRLLRKWSNKFVTNIKTHNIYVYVCACKDKERINTDVYIYMRAFVHLYKRVDIY